MAGCGGGRGGDELGKAVESSAPSPTAVPAGYVALDVVPDAGSVAGVVRIEGPEPVLQPRPITRDDAVCGHEPVPNPSLVIGKDHGVANAVVRLAGIRAGKKPVAASPLLDQKTCLFVPYMQVVTAGASVAIANSDAVLHNVHAYDAANTSLFNLGMPLQGLRIDQTFRATGPVRVKCDVHPWMFAWVWVAESPYVTLTDADGGFSIADVPPGTYTVVVWHELLGSKDSGVTVPPAGAANLNIALRAGA